MSEENLLIAIDDIECPGCDRCEREPFPLDCFLARKGDQLIAGQRLDSFHQLVAHTLDESRELFIARDDEVAAA